MNTPTTTALACSFLLTVALLAQVPGDARKVSDQELAQRISSQIRWAWYWEAHPLPNYTEDKKVEMAIVESSNKVAVFLADIGIEIVFGLDGKIMGTSGFPPTTNSAAMDEYLSKYDDDNSRTFLRDGKTSTTQQKKEKFKIRAIPYALPTLAPPESIQLRAKSTELPHLEAAIPAALKEWYTPTACGNGEVIVPYFSDNDPWVDVYVNLGYCGQGIIYFTHHDDGGAWQSSPFWPSRPPDDFSSIIKKIKDNAAGSILLPTPARVQ